jgi:hypothetical protein
MVRGLPLRRSLPSRNGPMILTRRPSSGSTVWLAWTSKRACSQAGQGDDGLPYSSLKVQDDVITSVRYCPSSAALLPTASRSSPILLTSRYCSRSLQGRVVSGLLEADPTNSFKPPTRPSQIIRRYSPSPALQPRLSQGPTPPALAPSFQLCKGCIYVSDVPN